jgi:hypothetical protein
MAVTPFDIATSPHVLPAHHGPLASMYEGTACADENVL